ncbi:hypothetical protein ACOME3_001586 [Neoechinorhynchus agilis]
MEFVDGYKITDVDLIRLGKINPKEVAWKMGKIFSDLIFKHGFVHCDPHPGNLQVCRENGVVKVILLDHALYQKLDDLFRYNYSRFWLGLLAGDETELMRLSEYFEVPVGLHKMLAVIVSGRTWDSVQKGLSTQRPTLSEVAALRDRIPDYFSDIAGVINSIPEQMLLLLKTNRLLESIEFQLGARFAALLQLHQACVLTREQYYRQHEASHFYQRLFSHLRQQALVWQARLYQIYKSISGSLALFN